MNKDTKGGMTLGIILSIAAIIFYDAWSKRETPENHPRKQNHLIIEHGDSAYHVHLVVDSVFKREYEPPEDPRR